MESGARTESSLEELYLGLYTPRGLYIYRHDLALGLTRAGRRTALQGYQVKLHGSKFEPSWQMALDDTILPRLDASECKCLAFVDWAL